MDSEDEVPQLSSYALAALQEFYKEQEERDVEIQQALYLKTTETINFEENWQLSQFWYDDNTKDVLAAMSAEAAGDHGKIALLCCPSIFPLLRKKSKHIVKLFEYDKRFSVYGEDFIFYDYNSPTEIPESFCNYFDVVVADPPFLSEECLRKICLTIKLLTENKIILCTGSLMEGLVKKLLNIERSCFEPKHKNNLGNEFSCYTNCESVVKMTLCDR